MSICRTRIASFREHTVPCHLRPRRGKMDAGKKNGKSTGVATRTRNTKARHAFHFGCVQVYPSARAVTEINARHHVRPMTHRHRPAITTTGQYVRRIPILSASARERCRVHMVEASWRGRRCGPDTASSGLRLLSDTDAMIGSTWSCRCPSNVQTGALRPCEPAQPQHLSPSARMHALCTRARKGACTSARLNLFGCRIPKNKPGVPHPADASDALKRRPWHNTLSSISDQAPSGQSGLDAARVEEGVHTTGSCCIHAKIETVSCVMGTHGTSYDAEKKRETETRRRDEI